MDPLKNKGGDTKRGTDRKQCRTRDESVDKVKLEIRETVGEAKCKQCPVARGSQGRDRLMVTVGRLKGRESENDRCVVRKNNRGGRKRVRKMRGRMLE